MNTLQYKIFKTKNKNIFVVTFENNIKTPPVFEIFINAAQKRLEFKKTAFFNQEVHDPSVIDPLILAFSEQAEWMSRSIPFMDLEQYLKSNDFKKLAVKGLLKLKA
jgi:hypothetical protein